MADRPKRGPQDLTLRNLQAQKKVNASLKQAIAALTKRVAKLEKR